MLSNAILLNELEAVVDYFIQKKGTEKSAQNSVQTTEAGGEFVWSHKEKEELCRQVLRDDSDLL